MITDGAALLALLDLDPQSVGLSEEAAAGFGIRVTRSFVNRMQRGDPQDPLLRQVLASAQELLPQPGFDADPVGEQDHANPVPGLLHKYHGRVLLLVTGACAIHCRYCFRRHFPYDANRNSRETWDRALDYIEADSSITEVIFSGGDPLMASDAQLADLVARLARIPQLRRLRIHTRLPIVLPERVTKGLLQAITHPSLRTTVVVHANHANEIDESVRIALHTLRDAGITVLNQAVLLAGINDTLDTQATLSETLFDAGVLPYYLHLLDKVSGAAHFDVDASKAKTLHAQLGARLPGYLVPRLVTEQAGEPGKTILR
jgi:EF-P beta-lysylation protein EpmB